METNKNECIELLDGTSLTCYPKVEEDLEMDDFHFTQAMPRYFVAGRYLCEETAGPIPLRELFRDNASVLYDIADRILSDSKLFFVPILRTDQHKPGGSTVRVLGMYIELWKSCPEATIVGKDGTRMVCDRWMPDLHFVGRNGASCVMKNFSSYLTINKKWEEIKHRYRGKTQKYQCHSLLQVLAMLENEGKLVIPEKANIIYRMATELARVDIANRQVVRDRTRMKILFHNHLIQAKMPEVRHFLKRMKAKKPEVDAMVDAAHNKKVALRIKLRKGELTPKHYESIWKPINRKKKAAIASYNNFVGETLRTLFPIERITLHEIEDYMYSQEVKNENTTNKDTIKF